MSPTTKKYASLCAATIITSLSLWNCSSNSHDEDSGTAALLGETSNVALNLDYSETPLLDSLVLDCYGTDTLHLVHSVEKKSFNLDLFPGDDWVFNAKLYANGTLMQEGEITTSLEAGSAVNLKIPMHPLVGFVYVKIPIGFGNPAGIKGGEMKLTSNDETYTYPMEFESEYATFTSGNIKLNRQYHISLSMQDENGKDIFSMEDDFTLDESTPIPSFQIASLRSKIDLAIDVANEVNIQASFQLQAVKRAPIANDLIISEFFLNANKSDSTQFNFVEFYNGSTDTLILSKCTFGKTSNTDGSAEFGAIEFPPNEVLVVGEAETADIAGTYKYTESLPAFVKGSGSIVLQCDGAILDSLYYGKADSLITSPIPVNTATSGTRKSTQLNIELWDNRDDGDSWCLGVPTPGVISACGN